MTKTKSYTAQGVCIEMTTYESLKVAVRSVEMKDTLLSNRPEIVKLSGSGLNLLKTFVDSIPYVIDIQQVEANEDGQMLAEWWDKHRDLHNIPEMWDEFWDLPHSAGNNLLVEAYKATRRDVLAPSPEFQGQSPNADPEEKKKKRRNKKVHDRDGASGGSGV